jgi:hypothetical protein
MSAEESPLSYEQKNVGISDIVEEADDVLQEAPSKAAAASAAPVAQFASAEPAVTTATPVKAASLDGTTARKTSPDRASKSPTRGLAYFYYWSCLFSLSFARSQVLLRYIASFVRKSSPARRCWNTWVS